MLFAIIGFSGFILGGLAVYVGLEYKRKQLKEIHHDLTLREHDLKKSIAELSGRELSFKKSLIHDREHADEYVAQKKEKIEQARSQFDQEMQRARDELLEKASMLDKSQREFSARHVSYDRLLGENLLLKGDLSNLTINLQKLGLDEDMRLKEQETLRGHVKDLGSRYLKENVKWIGKNLNPNNYSGCKDRLLDVISRCRAIGFEVTPEEENDLVADLKKDFEMIVRAAFEREEQARIKAQIREEQQREKEIQRELDRIERERAVLEAALAKALAETADEHSSQIEDLRKRLEEAEANKRAISQAQLTKSGYVYVISNVGSFGEGVFKIGMTRRLQPLDRVRELGDASVPFPFDVHMMISCDNAPGLEKALHHRLVKQQVNKTNPRKEFFRTDIATVVETVKENHGEVDFIVDAEALQYHQSLSMSEEDQAYIENVFEDIWEDEDLGDAE